ncbi:MAG: tetratricopeptide repeat protein [Reyranellaceae bacterium]
MAQSLQAAIALHQAGRLPEARQAYERLLKRQPRHADALHLLGVVLHQQGQHAAGLKRIDAALALNGANAFAHSNRAVVLHELMRWADSVASCDRAIALKPDYGDAWYNRGNALRRLKWHAEAVASYERAIELRPGHGEAWCNRGIALKQLNRFAEARSSFERALALSPGLGEAQLGLCMAELPILYEDEAEIATRRAAYETRLRALCATAEHNPGLARAVGTSQPFYLAYQGGNDRELQALYGGMVCRVMAARHPAVALPPPPAPDEPVRVGIVSGFFCQHTVWKLMIRGWLAALDRRRFRLFGYHTGSRQDAETEHAAALCTRFVRGPLPVDGWRAEIAADAPHVLLYPEVGMDPVAAALAAQRLAPVQCNAWGHPDTSGFPTLDHFLTSDLMEPPDGQAHYTESLVRLPNLSIHYEPIAVRPVAVTRGELGLRDGAVAFWCGQSLYKYLPQFDSIFPRIVRAAGVDCQFAFIEYDGSPQLTDLFRRRLVRAFAAHGLDAERHCVILPRLDLDRYSAANGLCDVFLDSLEWSGGNTTLETLAHDLPVVTLPGTFMRGRHSAAILRMMGATDTIAGSLDDYVAIAAPLARDPAWRAEQRAAVATHKHRVYRDRTAIAALEDFLERAARRPR